MSDETPRDPGTGRWGVNMTATPADGGPLKITSESAHASKHHVNKQKLREDKQPGDITLAVSYASGSLNVRPIGTRLGWVWAQGYGSLRRHAIRSAGLVRMGLATYVLGVAIGSRALFVGRGARLWRVPGVRLPEPAPSLASIDPDTARLFADAAARVLVDAMTPKQEVLLTDEAARRYRGIARALVSKRVLEAAAQGVPRDVATYAHGVGADWTAHDLIEPRCPDMQHALLLSLVLALPASDAASLIELGALIEHRVPLVTKEASTLIYQQACALLSRLCPEWWARSYLTDWDTVGCIDTLFRAQYCRMLNAAWENDTPIHGSRGADVATEPNVPHGEAEEEP